MPVEIADSVNPIFLDADPWVGIETGRELAGWQQADEVRTNQHWRYAERRRFFALTFDYLKENGIAGDYLEFGCHRVRTFRMALSEARKRQLESMRFLAFDSFQGLPGGVAAHGVANWEASGLCTPIERFHQIVADHGIYVDRVEAHRGFYGESLTAALQADLLARDVKVALVNIDCDLEESAMPILPFIEPLLQPGTVVYIDDYFAGYRGSPTKGVSRVFHDFIAASRFKAIEHLQVGWNGRSFILY